jgi:syntaxin 16
MEKEHLMRVKDLYGEEGEIMIDKLLTKHELHGGAELIEIEESSVKGHRSADIGKLVKQINELAVIFKELSILVVEQGTVLDRIDYNVQEARKST